MDTDYESNIQYLTGIGYQPYDQHRECTRSRSLPTLGTYCIDHEVRVLPAR